MKKYELYSKKYFFTGKLKDYGGELLLIGINYSKIEKRYECVIETIT